jgi:MFS family permease
VTATGPAVAADPSVRRGSTRPLQDWRVLLLVFWITSMVEGMGVSQIFALVPTYLREMGVAEEDRVAFVGLFSSLIFVVGLPLVPLWGVWADKYSRKAVIVRSALVEAIVFAGVALSREPWQLALSMLLIGFQLGNTGVMLAGIRDATPRRHVGKAIALFGASGPVGFALGPALGGVLVDGLGWSLPAVFWLSAGLSVATAALVAFGSREVRPEVIPVGRTLDLAFGAMRSVLSDRAVRRIFLIFGVSFLATQMSRPYIPLLVEELAGTGPGLVSAIALVAGTAALPARHGGSGRPALDDPQPRLPAPLRGGHPGSDRGGRGGRRRRHPGPVHPGRHRVHPGRPGDRPAPPRSDEPAGGRRRRLISCRA